MAFTPGISVSNPTAALATSNYVSAGTVGVFSIGVGVEYHAVGFATGNCLAGTGAHVFYPGASIGTVGCAQGSPYVSTPYLPTVCVAGVGISRYYSRFLKPGDTGIDISMLNLKRQLRCAIINIF